MIGRTCVQKAFTIGDSNVIAFDKFAEGVHQSVDYVQYQTTIYKHSNFGTELTVLRIL